MLKQLSIGDSAPAFSLPSDDGGTVSLAASKRRILVLYFYPKDDTSGCTMEATDFTAAIKKFAKAGAIVVGCSRDSIARHTAFKKKHELGIALASDEEGKVCAAYGVWVEKSMYGRKYMGIERSTFLIDGKGKIRAIWRKVKVPGHAEAVLAAIAPLIEQAEIK